MSGNGAQSQQNELEISTIRYSLLKASMILTMNKFRLNYHLLWLYLAEVSHFGEKLGNVSFIFTKQPTRAIEGKVPSFKKRPSPCLFPNRVFGLDRCQVKFCPLQTRWDQTNFGYFLQFLQSPLALFRRLISQSSMFLLKLNKSLIILSLPSNFNNWNRKKINNKIADW